MAKSSQDRLSRVRRPRVHIKYEIEKDGATVVRELPFVLSVMGDYSGESLKPLEPLGKRKFTQISRDTFDKVLKAIQPRVVLEVPDMLTGKGMRNVDLTFESMSDFEPSRIVAKVDSLQRLMEIRTRLRQLAHTADTSDRLRQILEQLMTNPEQILKQLGVAQPEPKEKQ